MRYKIQNLRNRTIIGSIVDLVPYDEKYIHEIIYLRNQQRVKYFLQQQYDINYEQQKAWIASYQSKDNEVGFIIKDKKGAVVGIMFLYNYNGRTIEIGRVTFDLKKIMGKPYTIEAASIILDLAFTYLCVSEVLAIVKEDNPLVRFNTKFGFEVTGKQLIRGFEYTEMQLTAANSKYVEWSGYVDAWKAKTERFS